MKRCPICKKENLKEVEDFRYKCNNCWNTSKCLFIIKEDNEN